MDNENLVLLALEMGFSKAAPLDVATLTPLDAVRGMCAADKCHHYGRCWTCPPACGSIEQNAARIARHQTGLIVQSTFMLDDDFDYEGMAEGMNTHQKRFIALRDLLNANHPDILALGAGGCNLCPSCTYPDAPCRMPDKALSSMEAYGLLVSDVCQRNGLAYYYGTRTISYTGCYLL